MIQPTLQIIDDKFVITIDKNSVNKVFLVQLLEKIRLEYLAQEVNFDESVVSLGKEIKASWWEENKDSFLNYNRFKTIVAKSQATETDIEEIANEINESWLNQQS